MALMLTVEASLLLRQVGMSEQDLKPLLSSGATIDLQRFKEAYTYAYNNKASKIEKLLAKQQYLIKPVLNN